jgi:hypothetical protein
MDQLLKFFPDDAGLVARMYAESPAFRSICEDLILADSALASLEAVQQERELAKVAEYRQLVLELQREITEILERCRPI